MPQHNPEWRPSKRLSKAFAMARKHHRLQSRKVGEESEKGLPYIGHLMGVAGLVIDHGGTEDQAIAALLHDTLEDTDVTRGMIRKNFGPAVADIVVACTDGEKDEKARITDAAGKLADWRRRKEAYLVTLGGKGGDDPSLLVALADKVHNATATERELRGVPPEQRPAYWGKFTAGEADQRWWYTSLASVFLARSAGQRWRPLAIHFDDTVAAMFPSARA